MNEKHGVFFRYGIAFLAVVAAIVIDEADFFSGNFRIYLTFYPFIAIAALLGGWGPGLFALALSCLALAIFKLEFLGNPAAATRADWLSLSIFILGNLFLIWICERQRQMVRETVATEAANRAKDRFLAILSHELRTPLTPALLTVGIYEKDPALPPEVRENLHVVRRNLELEARLIDDLLDLNRLVHGKIALRSKTRDLHEKIRNTLNICHAGIDSKGLNVTANLDAADHHVHGDDGRLQQIFWNLLRNAIKFTPSGGDLVLRTSNPRPDFVRVEIRDSGIGIDLKTTPRLFVAFEQGEKGNGGLGLGLAICKSLVELHGGKIWAESDGLDKGATFFVELPTVPAPAPAKNSARSAVSIANKLPEKKRAPKILLVEDNEDTLRILSRILEKSGYQITPVANKTAALAATEKFDLVISDLGLPDGDGRDLMRELRARDGLHGIAVSGYGMEEDIEKSREAGFLEHLTKPIEIEELKAAIERALE